MSAAGGVCLPAVAQPFIFSWGKEPAHRSQWPRALGLVLWLVGSTGQGRSPSALPRVPMWGQHRRPRGEE